MNSIYLKDYSPELLPEAIAYQRARRAKSNFRQFVTYLRGSDYTWNWHHKLVADKLDKFAKGEIKRLAISMPPRMGKSELGSRLLTPFILGLNPDHKVIASSYSSELASTMSRAVQGYMCEPEYAEIFPGTRLPAHGEKGIYKRTNSEFDLVGNDGGYFSTGVGGSVTGRGANFIIIDDPIKNQEEADSPKIRKRIYDWYRAVMYTRLEHNGGILLIMTRWHYADLAGMLIKDMENKELDTEPWDFVSIPAIREDLTNPDDPRKIGEALWKDNKSLEELLEIKDTVGSYWYPLYQQKPQSEEGAVFKRGKFNYYDPFALPLPTPDFYVDTAYTDEQFNDRTAIVAFCKQDNQVFIPFVGAEWAEFPRAVEWIQQVVRDHGGPESRVYIEPKASGLSIYQHLKKETELSVIKDKPPVDSKLVRAKGMSPKVDSGRVYLKTGAGWLEEFLSEVCEFPKAPQDDILDAFVGALKKSFKQGLEIL